jgi:hypothetical protein
MAAFVIVLKQAERKIFFTYLDVTTCGIKERACSLIGLRLCAENARETGFMISPLNRLCLFRVRSGEASAD